MSSTLGKNIKVSIFGQSHSPAIGVVIDGIPSGEAIDFNILDEFMARRAPGKSDTSTARREADKPEFLSGILSGKTCGAPIAAIIKNTDTKSRDYDKMKDIPRPGHADFTAHVKYGGNEDVAGGGHFSGRLTAPLCIAGGICKQLLERQGIYVDAEIDSVGGSRNKEEFRSIILAAKEDGDSVGGTIKCTVTGMPAGVGEPMFDGVENRIAAAVFGIPAVKGIEFGRGFEAADIRGSENNDAFYYEGDEVKTRTNNHGGILGGITSGMPITFRVAFKPTPSIALEQESISYSKKEQAKLVIEGRHDPCIASRAVPCVEAVAAIVIYDMILERK
ncbi:MAG TPA: chorismate synthase [Anaerovoracaceae bacterium]|nr:chorismate synthase [Anaerovoracaceae bacterium]